MGCMAKSSAERVREMRVRRERDAVCAWCPQKRLRGHRLCEGCLDKHARRSRDRRAAKRLAVVVS